jgi:hypothetical protein
MKNFTLINMDMSITADYRKNGKNRQHSRNLSALTLCYLLTLLCVKINPCTAVKLLLLLLLLLLLFWLQMGLYPVAAVLQYDTTHKITHRTQTKHSTHNYKNNKGHTAYSTYNYNTYTTTNTIEIQHIITIQIHIQVQYKYNTITINLKLMKIMIKMQNNTNFYY